MLDQKAMRRDDYEKGYKIKLADGQEWTFRKPLVSQFKFRRDAEGKTFLLALPHHGETLGDCIDRFVETEDPTQECLALFDAAYWMLQQNYTITFEQAVDLLPRYIPPHPAADANMAMWQDIADVLMGRFPKRTAVGSSPPSEPTASA